MTQRFDRNGKRHLILFRRQFYNPGFIGQVSKRGRERAVEEYVQNIARTFGAADNESAGKPEFVERMKTGNMVHVKMAEKKIDGTVIEILDVSVRLVQTVTGVEDHVIFLRADKGANRVSGGCVVPAVGS